MCPRGFLDRFSWNVSENDALLLVAKHFILQKSFKLLQEHEKIHRTAPKKLLDCTECGEMFETRGQLNASATDYIEFIERNNLY